MKILILGIGNLLMGDEGVGVHTIRELEKISLPANIDLLDGGTGGFHLLEYFQTYKRLVMIDATMDGEKAGTIKLIKPKFASDFPKALSAHDIGLKDLVESAAILGSMPEVYLFTITISEIKSMTMELSDEVRNAVPSVIEQIITLIKTLAD